MDLVAGALKKSSDHNQLVRLYWIARYDYEPTWVFREHIHDFAQIIYIIEGEGTASLCGSDVTLSPGVIWFMAPGVPHALTKCYSRPVRTIDVKFAIAPGTFHDALCEICTPVQDQDNKVLHVLQRTHQEAIKHEAGHHELCNALMTEALVMILRGCRPSVAGGDLPGPEDPLDDRLVERAREFIHRRFAASVNLHELAEELGMSQQYLARRFKKAMGTTVHEYLLRYRVQQAKERLRYLQGPIKEVAFDVGFKSIHHFTRVFSRLEQMPPAAWRERQSGVGRQGITVTPGFVAVDVTVDDKSNEFIGL